MRFEIHPILQKTLALQFYKKNGSFFLLIIVLTFGFMSGREHMALAQFFTGSAVTLLIPFVIWIFYLFKIITFTSQQVSANENAFLHHLLLLPTLSKWINCVSVAIVQMQPVILYGCFLIFVAVSNSLFSNAALIALVVVFVVLSTVYQLLRAIENVGHEKHVSPLKIFLDRKVSKPLVVIELEWLLRRELFMFIGIKTFAILLLLAVTYLYTHEPYDERLMAMAMIVISASNFGLLRESHKFNNYHFLTIRNLPVSVWRHLVRTLIVVVLISIPELIVLTRKFPGNLSNADLATIVFEHLSAQLLIYATMFFNYKRAETAVRVLFTILIVTFFAILFTTPLLYVSLLLLIPGVAIYRHSFYDYEATLSAST